MLGFNRDRDRDRDRDVSKENERKKNLEISLTNPFLIPDKVKNAVQMNSNGIRDK